MVRKLVFQCSKYILLVTLLGILVDGLPWLINGVGYFSGLVFTLFNTFLDKLLLYSIFSASACFFLLGLYKRVATNILVICLVVFTIIVSVCLEYVFYKDSLQDASYILSQTQGKSLFERVMAIFQFEPSLFSFIMGCMILSFLLFRRIVKTRSVIDTKL
jgi:hypothetical protein